MSFVIVVSKEEGFLTTMKQQPPTSTGRIRRLALWLFLAGVFVWNVKQNRLSLWSTSTNDNAVVASAVIVPGLSICERNPYLPALRWNPSEIYDFYHYKLGSYYLPLAESDPQTKHTHGRFRVFEELATCIEETCSRCGADVSKIMCGLSALNKQKNNTNDGNNPPCVVYSIGGNNQWQFEQGVLENTPNCQVHTFDCTGNQTRFQVPSHDRLEFHYECMAGDVLPPELPDKTFLTLSEMSSKYRHPEISLLKMDIEGFEWPVFAQMKSMTSEQRYTLPMQVRYIILGWLSLALQVVMSHFLGTVVTVIRVFLKL